MGTPPSLKEVKMKNENLVKDFRYSIKYKGDSHRYKGRFINNERGFIRIRLSNGEILTVRPQDVNIQELPPVANFLYARWPSMDILAEGDDRDELQDNICSIYGEDHFSNSVMMKNVITSKELILFGENGSIPNFIMLILSKEHVSKVLSIKEEYESTSGEV
jgi:hypothetical protein